MKKFVPLTVNDVNRETADTVSISFEIPQEHKEDFSFVPGQYLTLKTEINGEDVRRSYSISSGTNEDELRVAVKQIEGGLFSTFANTILQPGDELEVLPPLGRFTIETNPDNKKHYVLVAAGSGITPMMSMIKSVLTEEPNSEVSLIYGNRYFDTIIFREEIENLKDIYIGRFRPFHVLSGALNEIDLFQGRIDGEKVKKFFNTFLDFDSCSGVYLCGPEDMVKSVKDSMLEMGMDKSDVHFELFITNKQIKDSGKVVEAKVESKKDVHVKVTLYGQQWEFDMAKDEYILDVASTKGLDVPYSCKGGMCCTCKAKMESGQVDMTVNYALESEEVEEGYILTCQAKPTTNEVDVNFDI